MASCLGPQNGASSRYHTGFNSWLPSTGDVFTATLQVPAAKPVGFEGTQFHVIMKTDSTDVVSETNEWNNAGSRGQGHDRDALTIRNHNHVSYGFRDASHDDSSTRAMSDGALRYGFNLNSQNNRWWDPIQTNTVRIEALHSGSIVATWDADNTLSDSNELLNLNSKNLSTGWHQFRVAANRWSGSPVTTSTSWIYVQSGSRISGDFTAETFEYSTMSGHGVVINGRGGTDTLDLGLSQSTVSSFNGQALSDFNALEGAVSQQAILKGSTYDFIRLSNGREIYFQGIERLQFSDGSTMELSIEAVDPQFDDQWNLHTQDVPGAWRFTRGSDDILLVTLDTGVLTPDSRTDAPVEDMELDRMITDAGDDDNLSGGSYGHGHKATSIMAATANNAEGITGINWNSPVYATDVYVDDSLEDAIVDAVDYAKTNTQKVVFQGGIQGESWLNDGFTQAELEDYISDNSNMSLFAVAAGNGNEDIDDTTPSDASRSGGVARLAGSHGNVIAVGAASPYGSTEAKNNTTMVNGRRNTTDLDRRSYSNFGDSLTMMAATDVPAVTKSGAIDSRFGGTSAANPNMAGISSLVWSALPSAAGATIRSMLVQTAMDLEAAGRDDNTGYGMADAEGAVRKAIAKARDPQLASLFQPFLMMPTSTGFSRSFSGSFVAPDATEGSAEAGTAAPPVTVAELQPRDEIDMQVTDIASIPEQPTRRLGSFQPTEPQAAIDMYFAEASELPSTTVEEDDELLQSIAENRLLVA